MNQNNAIEVRDMSKYFIVDKEKSKTAKEKILFWKKNTAKKHQVLKDVNLDIKKGETVALIGTNGSGKSTLLKLMTKIIFPNQGIIETNGKLTSLLELGAGFHIEFTGRENIYFNASIFGLTRKEIDARIDDIIEFSELGEFIDQPVRTYSSGMYMRLAFSVAINVDADILLIDEILAVGDQHFQDKCFRKLHELRDSGKTIVIVSHSLDVVKKLCHRAIWIYKGEVKEDGHPVYVIEEYLKQVAIDHKEEIHKKVMEGKEKNRGIIYIDVPSDFSNFSLQTPRIECAGWQISDCENDKLLVIVDDKVIENVIRIPREDVFSLYAEEFAGFLNVEDIGWKFFLSPKELGIGNHKVVVKCLNDKGEMLAENEINISIA